MEVETETEIRTQPIRKKKRVGVAKKKYQPQDRIIQQELDSILWSIATIIESGIRLVQAISTQREANKVKVKKTKLDHQAT